MTKLGDVSSAAGVEGSELPDVLTVEQAAELLQLSAKTLKRLAQAERVPSRRVGNQWRFGRQALMD